MASPEGAFLRLDAAAVPRTQLGPGALDLAPHCWHGPIQHQQAGLAQMHLGRAVHPMPAANIHQLSLCLMRIDICRAGQRRAGPGRAGPGRARQANVCDYW